MYKRADILKFCEIGFLDINTFYKSDMVNYRGKTSDSGEYCTEIIAEFLCNNINEF